MRLTTRHLAALVAGAVVLSPLARDPVDDTYPLSTYPMFAGDRGAVHRIATAVEIGPAEEVWRLSPALIAGTSEPVLASVTVARAVAEGSAAVLCEEIAARLGAERVVEVRTETIDVIAFVADGAEPVAVQTHARCGDG